MKKIVLLMGILLVGCSSSESENTQKTEQISIENESKKLDFPSADQHASLPKVDIHDDEAIVKSAGTPVKKVSDSTDTDGKPKKIYQFSESAFGTQIELSKNQIVLAWVAVNEDESSRTKSLASIAIAQKLAVSIFGIEGGKLVDELTQKGKIDPQNLNGHQVLMGTCTSGMCLLKIDR
jgi:cell division protein FtsI/penicillin-binding protein 2